MRKGFTILELLVASLLLSMLVTMLTMIFNQSSMAWNTGVASVGDLETVRKKMGGYHDVADDILPGIGQTGVRNIGDSGRKIEYRTVSVWQKNSSQLRTDRAYDVITFARGLSASDFQGTGNLGQQKSLEGGQTAGSGLFTVGVRSAGPNGTFGDDDDITTWPDEVF